MSRPALVVEFNGIPSDSLICSTASPGFLFVLLAEVLHERMMVRVKMMMMVMMMMMMMMKDDDKAIQNKSTFDEIRFFFGPGRGVRGAKGIGP